jgi:hypothetical protein
MPTGLTASALTALASWPGHAARPDFRGLYSVGTLTVVHAGKHKVRSPLSLTEFSPYLP